MPYALCPREHLMLLRKAICIFPLIYLNLDRQSQIYHLKLTLSLIFSPQPGPNQREKEAPQLRLTH